MIEVKARPLKDLLFDSPLGEYQRFSFPSYFVNRHLFDVRFALLAAGPVFFLIGLIWSRGLMILGLTLICYYLVQYLTLRSIAKGIHIKRVSLPDSLIELEEIRVKFDIYNASRFDLYDFTISDSISLSTKTRIDFSFDKKFAARSKMSLGYRRFCDGGMGHHSVGPLRVTMTDPLRLFEFTTTLTDIHEIQVYPKIQPVGLLPLTGRKQNHQYGLYEILEQGESVNFSGLREYRPGDSLRHISWTASARGQGLVVKEFEKSVNTSVSFVLNLDPRLHLGSQSESTWEYAKDLTLSLMSQQIDVGNEVQVLTNSFHIDFNKGEAHLHEISRKLTQALPNIRELLESDRDDLLIEGAYGEARHKPVLSVYRDWVPAFSTLIYVTTDLDDHFEANKEVLFFLKTRGVNVHVFLLDARSFYDHYKSRLEWVPAVPLSGIKSQREIRYDLEVIGIKTHLLRFGEKLSEKFKVFEDTVL